MKVVEVINVIRAGVQFAAYIAFAILAFGGLLKLSFAVIGWAVR